MTVRAARQSSNDAKRARTRARLTDAALRLMADRGISATSVSEIAAEADVANGTFYLYFRDKGEIVAAVCEAVTRAMHEEMSSTRLSLHDAAARVAFGTQQFIEIAAAEPVWGRLLLTAFSEFEAIKTEVARYMRLDVALGVEQGRFKEPFDEFIIEAHVAILRAAVSARLAGGGPDIGARAAEYQLRILGMSIAQARAVRRGNEARTGTEA